MRSTITAFLLVFAFQSIAQIDEISALTGVPEDSLITGKEFRILDTIQTLQFDDGTAIWSMSKRLMVDVSDHYIDTMYQPVSATPYTDVELPVPYWWIDTIFSADDPRIILAIDTNKHRSLELSYAVRHHLNKIQMERFLDEIEKRAIDQGFATRYAVMWVEQNGQIHHAYGPLDIAGLVSNSMVIQVDCMFHKKGIGWSLLYPIVFADEERLAK